MYKNIIAAVFLGLVAVGVYAGLTYWGRGSAPSQPTTDAETLSRQEINTQRSQKTQRLIAEQATLKTDACAVQNAVVAANASIRACNAQWNVVNGLNVAICMLDNDARKLNGQGGLIPCTDPQSAVANNCGTEIALPVTDACKNAPSFTAAGTK